MTELFQCVNGAEIPTSLDTGSRIKQVTVPTQNELLEISTNLSGGVESQNGRSLTASARHAESACKHVDLAKDDLKCSALVRSDNASGSNAPPAQNNLPVPVLADYTTKNGYGARESTLEQQPATADSRGGQFISTKGGDAECAAPAENSRVTNAPSIRAASNAAPKFNPLVAAVDGRSVGRGNERQIVALDSQG